MTEPNTPETTQLDTSKMVTPDENSSNESTPVHDELAKATVDDEDEEDETAPEKAKAYKADVGRALDRETQDGQGDEDPGPSDFISYATEGVEKEDDV